MGENECDKFEEGKEGTFSNIMRTQSQTHMSATSGSTATNFTSGFAHSPTLNATGMIPSIPGSGTGSYLTTPKLIFQQRIMQSLAAL